MLITSFHSPCGVILGQYELVLYSKLLHDYVKTVITLKFVAFATRNTHSEHGCLARMQTMSRARSAEQMADNVVTVRTNVESFSFTFCFY